MARRLKAQSPVLRDALDAGRLKIVAARYDLDDGDVDWFEDAGGAQGGGANFRSRTPEVRPLRPDDGHGSPGNIARPLRKRPA